MNKVCFKVNHPAGRESLPGPCLSAQSLTPGGRERMLTCFRSHFTVPTPILAGKIQFLSTLKTRAPRDPLYKYLFDSRALKGLSL